MVKGDRWCLCVIVYFNVNVTKLCVHDPIILLSSPINLCIIIIFRDSVARQQQSQALILFRGEMPLPRFDEISSSISPRVSRRPDAKGLENLGQAAGAETPAVRPVAPGALLQFEQALEKLRCPPNLTP